MALLTNALSLCFRSFLSLVGMTGQLTGKGLINYHFIYLLAVLVLVLFDNCNRYADEAGDAGGYHCESPQPEEEREALANQLCEILDVLACIGSRMLYAGVCVTAIILGAHISAYICIADDYCENDCHDAHYYELRRNRRWRIRRETIGRRLRC